MNSRLLLGLTLSALVFTASEAASFCRTTTCNPADPTDVCRRNAATGCIVTGAPLYWASDCITLSVQADGAPRSGIDYEAAEASVKRAVAAWTSAKCRGGSPSLRVDVTGPVSCDASEYSGEHRNANIVMFRENYWPYQDSEDALGYTRVRFDLEDAPGSLWDADIEINAVTEPLSAGEPADNEVDLDSLLTHEMGHLLGLAHTLDETATMRAGYTLGSTEVRTPEADDIAGLCAIYPPGRELSSSSCEPRHGFSELCHRDQPAPDSPPAGACAISTAPRSAGFEALFWFASLGWLGRARRCARR
jgi:hypothetical protein